MERENSGAGIAFPLDRGEGTSPVPQSAGEGYLFFEPIFDLGLCFIEAAFRIRSAC